MKRVFIIHCWEGYLEYCWYPYLKRELKARGFKVEVPAFPDTDNPKQNKWVSCLAEQVGAPDENTFLVGHSIGAATILRYLETLPDNEKIGGAVFVAGFTEDIGYEEVENFFKVPFDFTKIKSRAKKGFVAIHSDNDPYIDLKFSKIFQEKFGAEIIIEHAKGHFSGSIENEPACTELPIALEKILEMAEAGP